ncbi:MAG: hypothetical protein VKJ64_17965 [Leptolyngbyaceae bacterium]|nr:hypothetical protein [Leptolyngbyaceae bacterium]
MARVSNKPLKQNPFHTIRDPETGKWMVVHPEPRSHHISEAEQAPTQTTSNIHTVSRLMERVSTAA